MPDTYNTFKIGIGDLRHLYCGTPLILKYTDKEEAIIMPYCQKCKQFMKNHSAIQVNPGWDTQRKIITMIETMSKVDFRVKMKRGKLRGL